MRSGPRRPLVLAMIEKPSLLASPRRLRSLTSVATRPAVKVVATCFFLLGMFGVAYLAYSGAAPSRVAFVLALTFLPYASLALGPGEGLRPRAVVALALLAGLPLVLAPPTLSDDVFRYLWDGHVTLSGIDPYLYAPDDAALAALRNAAWSQVNHRQIPTIYPPLAQLIFVIGAAFAHGKAVVSLLALLAHAGVALLVPQLAPGHARRAVALYALNPLVLTESALAGHVDVFVGLCLAASVLALARGHALRGGLFAGLASGVKLAGFALLPLFRPRQWRGLGLALLLGAVALVPLLGAGSGSGVTGGLGQYARRWEGNAGPYALAEAGLTRVVSAAGREQRAPEGHVHLPGLRSLLVAVHGTWLDPRAGLVSEKKQTLDPTDFLAATVAGLLLRALIVLGVLTLGALLTWRRVPPLQAARLVLLLGLLCAPQVHPWYLLWLLPLEVAAGGVAGLVWSATILLAYVPLDAWLASRVWVESPALVWTEYGLVLVALAWEVRAWLRHRGKIPETGHVEPVCATVAPTSTGAHIDPSTARS